MNKYDAAQLDNNEFYVDYDVESDCWGVFGESSGFCYALFASQGGAEDWMKKHSVR